MNSQERTHLNKVLTRDGHELWRKPNVVGVGLGTKVTGGIRNPFRTCITVLVAKKEPTGLLPVNDLVPKNLGGAETDVIEVGTLKAQTVRKPEAFKAHDPTGRCRPVWPGCSVGHFSITAGTLGLIVKSKATDEELLLSNNHVLANSNQASIGDQIWQPGSYDGGTSKDVIAYLTDYVEIMWDGAGGGGGPVLPPECPIAGKLASVLNAAAAVTGRKHRLQAVLPSSEVNIMDAAIASFDGSVEFTRSIPEIGIPKGTMSTVEPGQFVQKYGRTTRHTTGHVLSIDTQVRVQYDQGKTATFHDQIVAGAMSQGGDSGSAVLTGDQVVGLLFAGSDQATIFSPIVPILEELDVYLA